MDDERSEYARQILRHRAPELTDDDLAGLAGDQDASLRLDVADQVADVIGALMDKLESILDRLQDAQPTEQIKPPLVIPRSDRLDKATLDAVEACWVKMVDLTLDQKDAALEELERRLAMEEATSEPIQ